MAAESFMTISLNLAVVERSESSCELEIAESV